MLLARRDIQIPLRNRFKLPPLTLSKNRRRKIPYINVASIERDDVDQALAPIAVAPDERPTLISAELPQFEANYVANRPRASRYAGLSKMGFFRCFSTT